jgi:hypothetical protein
MITTTIPGMTRVAPIGSANAGAMSSPSFDAFAVTD